MNYKNRNERKVYRLFSGLHYPFRQKIIQITSPKNFRNVIHNNFLSLKACELQKDNDYSFDEILTETTEEKF